MRFRPNPHLESDIAKDVRSATKYRQALVSAARPAAAVANQLGHAIMPKGKGTAITVQTDAEGVYIVNEAYGSHLDEWGSVNNPPYAPLRRGVRAGGLRLDEH